MTTTSNELGAFMSPTAKALDAHISSKRIAAADLHRTTSRPQGQHDETADTDTDMSNDPEQKWHVLYDVDALRQLVADKRRLNTPNDDKELMLMKKMLALPAVRPVASVPDNYRDIAKKVMEDAPNFGNWIEEFLVPELALTMLSGDPLKITPTLFVGDAGAGKTRFCEVLANAFEMPSSHCNLETEQSSSSIIGSARFWSNSKPGVIFEYYVQDNAANPVFVFEELDKAAGAREYSVMSAFYQLLEPTSARRFFDLSLPGLTLDIRPASWLFTANETTGIPAPILSRLNVVHIPSLTPDQARSIALKQFAAMAGKLGAGATSLRMTDAALDALATHSPRQQRMLLFFAMGRAIANGRDEIAVLPSQSVSRQRLGFI